MNHQVTITIDYNNPDTIFDLLRTLNSYYKDSPEDFHYSTHFLHKEPNKHIYIDWWQKLR